MSRILLRQYPAAVQLLIFIAIWLFCQLLTAGAIIPAVLKFAWGIDFSANFHQQATACPNAALLINFLGSMLLFLVPGMLFAIIISSKPIRYTGLGQKADIPVLTWTLLAGIAMVFVLPDISEWLQKAGFGNWADELQKERQEMEAIYFRNRTTAGLLRNIILLGLVPAFCEEVFFRGIMQKLLQMLSNNKWIAIICTSILFGLIHNSFYNFLPIFLASLILGYVYIETGSLWVSIFMHFVYNLSQVVIVHISGPDGTTITDSVWIKILIELAAAAMIMLCLKMIHKYRISADAEHKDQENFVNH